MRVGWSESNLSELYEFSSGLSKGRKYFGTGYPFLTYKEIFNNIFAPNILKSLVETSKKEREKHSIMRGDVFLTRTSETVEEIGISCVAIKDYPNATFNGFAKRLRPKTGKILPEYAGYYFRNRQFQQMASSLCTLITRASLNNNDLSYLTIYYPSKNHQRKIASILSPYDDLIENNTRRIKILEEMAQRIYREWFVHFRFPGHEKVKMVESALGMIPEGWKINDLKEFGEILTGKTPSKKRPEYYDDDIPFIKTPDMHDNMFCIITGECLSELGAQSQSNKTLPPNSLCVSCIGTAGVVSITAIPSQTNQQINSIKIKQELLREFLFFSLVGLKETINLHGATGATMVNLSKGKFESLKVTTPPNNLIKSYHEIAEPIFDEIKNLQYKNHNLRQTRDLLLPKLISGKIDVEDLNIEIPDEVGEMSNIILTNSQLIGEAKGIQTGSISKKNRL